MDEKKQDLDTAQPSNQTKESESIYKGLENVPLKVLDFIIWLCVAALVIVIAVGFMNR